MSSSDFSQKVQDAIMKGFIAAGISLGTRLKLFDAIASLSVSQETAVTTQVIADYTKCKERYIREWINGMVCADMVDHCVENGIDKYWLAPFRLPALTHSAEGCPASSSQLLSGVTQNSRSVEACFPIDGPPGTEVDDYPGLHEFLATKYSPLQDVNKIDAILNDEQLIKKLEKGAKVIELGCGAAHPVRTMATRFPNSSFVASELSESVLSRAKENCKDLANVSYAIVDACDVPDSMADQFDLVILFDVFHDVPYPIKLLQGACKLLKLGGKFIMNEINMFDTVEENKVKCGAQGCIMYMIGTLYCMPTSVKHPGGAGLGPCAGPKVFEDLLKESGLGEIVKRCDEIIGLTFCATKTLEMHEVEPETKKTKSE